MKNGAKTSWTYSDVLRLEYFNSTSIPSKDQLEYIGVYKPRVESTRDTDRPPRGGGPGGAQT